MENTYSEKAPEAGYADAPTPTVQDGHLAARIEVRATRRVTKPDKSQIVRCVRKPAQNGRSGRPRTHLRDVSRVKILVDVSAVKAD